MCGGDYGATAICCGYAANANCLRATLSDRNSKVQIMYVKMNDETLQAKMSGNAKNLYSVLLDRYELSAKKGFTNAKGQVVCKMKCAEIMERLSVSRHTAMRLIAELRTKGLIETKKTQSGDLEFQVFSIFASRKSATLESSKSATLESSRSATMESSRSATCYTYKPNTLSQITKPNARMRTHEASQSEPSQNQLSEATSRHHFSQSELGNSRISSGAQGKTQDKTQAQDKPQAPSTARQWLGINDKPSYISEQTWQDFCAYKRERRHNFTATGKKAFFAKLDDIEAKSGACETAIKNTMANGWQGVFMPPLDKKQGKGQSMQPAQMVDALQEWLSDREAQVIESELALPQALPSERRA